MKGTAGSPGSASIPGFKKWSPLGDGVYDKSQVLFNIFLLNWRKKNQSLLKQTNRPAILIGFSYANIFLVLIKQQYFQVFDLIVKPKSVCRQSDLFPMSEF
jgi:hypothetical protein